MELRPADTDEATYQVWLDVLRSLPPEQKLRNVFQLSEQHRELTKTGIALRHPEYTPKQVEWALRRWWWGDALFAEVHPGVPLLEP